MIHGAAAPQVRAKALERLTEAKARSLADVAGAPPLVDPFNALLQLAGEFVMLKDVLGDMVGKLRTLALEDEQGREHLRVNVAAYERALERTGRLLVDIARLDIDERLVRINLEMAKVIFRFVMGVLEHPDLGLDAGRIDRAKELLAEATKP